MATFSRARRARQEVVRLEDEADGPAADLRQLVVGELLHRVALQAVDPGGRAVQAAQDVHQRRLARAGRADDGQELAVGDHQVDVLEGGHGDAAGVVDARHALQVQERRDHGRMTVPPPPRGKLPPPPKPPVPVVVVPERAVDGARLHAVTDADAARDLGQRGGDQADLDGHGGHRAVAGDDVDRVVAARAVEGDGGDGDDVADRRGGHRDAGRHARAQRRVGAIEGHLDGVRDDRRRAAAVARTARCW